MITQLRSAFSKEIFSEQEITEFENVFKERLTNYNPHLMQSASAIPKNWNETKSKYEKKSKDNFEKHFTVYRNSLWKQANVNNSLLMVYIEIGSKKNAEQFLSDSPDHLIKEKNIDGYTALMMAASFGELEILKMLLDKGAKIDDKNNNGHTPLGLASIAENTNIIKELISRDYPNKKEDINTALLIAAERKKIESVKILIDNVHIQELSTILGEALILASKQGHVKIVEFLIDSRADINYKKNNQTALMLATHCNQKEVVDTLLRKNARTDYKDENENTALKIATILQYEDLISLLVEKSNEKDINEAREFAIKHNRSALIDKFPKTQIYKWNKIKEAIEKENMFFLSNQTPEDLSKEYEGSTALNHAILQNKVDVIKLFVEKGIKIQNLFLSAVKNNMKHIADILIQGDFGLDEVDEETGNTALLFAIKKKWTDIANSLIDKGAKADWKNKRNETALLLATQKECLETLRKLGEKQPEVYADKSDLDAAISEAKESGYIEIEDYLNSKKNVGSTQNIKKEPSAITNEKRKQSDLNSSTIQPETKKKKISND